MFNFGDHVKPIAFSNLILSAVILLLCFPSMKNLYCFLWVFTHVSSFQPHIKAALLFSFLYSISVHYTGLTIYFSWWIVCTFRVLACWNWHVSCAWIASVNTKLSGIYFSRMKDWYTGNWNMPRIMLNLYPEYIFFIKNQEQFPCVPA